MGFWVDLFGGDFWFLCWFGCGGCGLDGSVGLEVVVGVGVVLVMIVGGGVGGGCRCCIVCCCGWVCVVYCVYGVDDCYCCGCVLYLVVGYCGVGIGNGGIGCVVV